MRVAISPPFSHLNVKGEGQETCFQQGFTFRTRREKEGGRREGASLVAKEKSALFSFPLSYWVRRGGVGRGGGGARAGGEEKINTQTAEKYRGADSPRK